MSIERHRLPFRQPMTTDPPWNRLHIRPHTRLWKTILRPEHDPGTPSLASAAHAPAAAGHGATE
jgi:hypothetical protein